MCSKSCTGLFPVIDMVVVIQLRIRCRKIKREAGKSFLLLIFLLCGWNKFHLPEIIHLKMR